MRFFGELGTLQDYRRVECDSFAERNYVYIPDMIMSVFVTARFLKT